VTSREGEDRGRKRITKMTYGCGGRCHVTVFGPFLNFTTKSLEKVNDFLNQNLTSHWKEGRGGGNDRIVPKEEKEASSAQIVSRII